MQLNGDSYCRTILNAIPIAIFVVDIDVRIQDLNNAAATAFGLDKGSVLKRRGGSVLHCLHRHDVPEGCGRGEYCQSCVIRNSVKASLLGQTITRKRTKFHLSQGEKKKEVELLITASPIVSDKNPLALLVIEDISEIIALREIIPICMHCKRIRDDQEYWHNVESYFRDHIGVDFSHGICPNCLRELYPEFAK